MDDLNLESYDWESHWARYTEAASANPGQNYRHQLMIGEIQKIAHSLGRLRIMDIGCGQGDLLLKISSAFPQAELAGLELSEVGVEISKKKVPRATIYKADILNPTGIASKYYNWANIICCSEVLEHVDDPVDFLDHMSDYVCNDGFAIITVPGGPRSDFDKYIGHRRHFSKSSLTQLFSDAKNYSLKKVYKSGFPFFNLYRLVVILRGAKLKSDVQLEEMGVTNKVALIVMRIFGLLFKANLRNSLFGWQMLVIAQVQNKDG